MEDSANILYPIDLSIFKEHVKMSFLSILDNVRYTFNSFQA